MRTINWPLATLFAFLGLALFVGVDSGEKHWFFNYQGIIGSLITAGVAFFAIQPVVQQLKETKRQSATVAYGLLSEQAARMNDEIAVLEELEMFFGDINAYVRIDEEGRTGVPYQVFLDKLIEIDSRRENITNAFRRYRNSEPSHEIRGPLRGAIKRHLGSAKFSLGWLIRCVQDQREESPIEIPSMVLRHCNMPRDAREAERDAGLLHKSLIEEIWRTDIAMADFARIIRGS